MLRYAIAAIALGTVLLTVSSGVIAGPLDARVGETRAVYNREGTNLRSQPSAMGASVATLPKGCRVTVLEVKQPWLRVRSPRGEGWVMSGRTVEPSVLNPNPRPVHTAAAQAAHSDRDVSAASRQLDAETERRYRVTRRDLQNAYRLVDEMEAATQALDPSESIGFIAGGALGGRGRTYDRPPLLPPTQPAAAQPRQGRGGRRQPQQPQRGGRRGGIGGLLGGLAGEAAGEAARRLGGGQVGEDIARGLVETSTSTVQQLRERFTPENEYYLGRAVAANAIAKYGIDPNPARRQYVRLVGDALVRVSTRLPSTFGGYHFEVLNSDEINGVSGPGGFVLITRGAVNACSSEDELAAILAHELAHVKLDHGESTLRSGRGFQTFMQGLVQTGTTAANMDKERWQQALTQFFSKVVGEMSRTASEHNYGRAAEFQADIEGTYILVDVFYDHAALRDLLQMLANRPGGAFAKAATHAPPAYRVGNLNPIVTKYGAFRGGDRIKEARRNRLNRNK